MIDERNFETLLEQFSPRPAPRELRGKVIQAAYREAEARRVLTPAWRWVLASSSVLTAIFMLADWRLSSREQNRLSSLLNPPGASSVSPERAADEKAGKVLAYLPDLDAASRQALRGVILNEERASLRSRHPAQPLTEEINEY
jgi:hypothetical protein